MQQCYVGQVEQDNLQCEHAQDTYSEHLLRAVSGCVRIRDLGSESEFQSPG